MKRIKNALKKTFVLPLYLNLKKKKNRLRGKIRKFVSLRIVFPTVYRVNALKPLDEKKVIFVEVRASEITNNFKLLFDELVAGNDFNVHCHFLRNATAPRKEYVRLCIAFLKDMATAKYVFVNDASNVISCVKKREGTIITQMWHGCGAFKKFGMSTANLIFGESKKEIERYPNYGNLDYVTVSSEEVSWAYVEAMNLKGKESIVKPIGLSRTDVFFDEDFIKRAKEKLLDIMPSSEGKKVILYAPTFRGRVASAYSPNKLSVAHFYESLSDDYVLLCKHHPFVKRPPKIPAQYGDFAKDVTKLMEIDELLCVSDICISDYSSLVFEYSLFEKPMLFFAYDLENYCDWRGFYYDYHELTPGTVCKTTEELVENIKALEQNFDKALVRAFKQKFMSACDGNATHRLMDMVVESLDTHRR